MSFKEICSSKLWETVSYNNHKQPTQTGTPWGIWSANISLHCRSFTATPTGLRCMVIECAKNWVRMKIINFYYLEINNYSKVSPLSYNVIRIITSRYPLLRHRKQPNARSHYWVTGKKIRYFHKRNNIYTIVLNDLIHTLIYI
jgi:hypothetical protein